MPSPRVTTSLLRRGWPLVLALAGTVAVGALPVHHLVQHHVTGRVCLEATPGVVPVALVGIGDGPRVALARDASGAFCGRIARVSGVFEVETSPRGEGGPTRCFVGLGARSLAVRAGRCVSGAW